MPDFVDVVALLVDYLSPLVGGVPVRSRTPRPLPPTWIQVRRVGGAYEWPITDRARVDIFTWAAEESEAADLCETVRNLLHALRGSDALGRQVYDVAEFSGPRSIDDPESGSPRYWMTFTFAVRV